MNPMPATPAAPSPAGPLPPLPPAWAANSVPAPPSATPCRGSRAYPWLLTLSTATAGLFCLLYINKPVIVTAPAPPALAESTPRPVKRPAAPATPVATAKLPEAPILPNPDRLPGDAPPATSPRAGTTRLPVPGPASSPFEETNLRVQHILTAEAPGGFLARINLDVPVLYQSRHLRWTPTEVAEARSLLNRLMDYQEKSKQLRAEGGALLDAWNRLIDRSLPGSDLRADSPSLPANQQDALHPTATGAPDSIQLQPTGK